MERKIRGELLQAMQRNESENTVNASSLLEIHRSLSSLISQLQVVANTNTGETHILRKLYFNSIYARSDAILDAESGTFGWLLEDERRKSQPPDTDDERISHRSNSSSSRTVEIEKHEILSGENTSNDNSLNDGLGAQGFARIELSESEDLSDNGHSTDLQLQDLSDQDCEDEDGEEEEREDDGLSGQSEDKTSGSDSDGLSGDSEGEDDLEATSVTSEGPVRYPEELELHQQTRNSFLKWLNSGNQIYHISGKAGSGKSTLMKSLTHDPRLMEALKMWAGDKKLVVGSFYFWGSGDVQQRSLEGLYRSLLFEILNQCPELIKEVFPNHWHNFQAKMPGWEEIPFRLSELRDAMSIIVGTNRLSNHRFCFFIDGLDEFEADTTDHWELAQVLQQWATSDDVKLCVSSRPYTEFLEVFNSNLRMELHHLTRGDIERFIRAQFDTLQQFSSDNEAFAEIVGDIVESAAGVFLWVRLVVRSLLDGVRHRFSLATLKEKLHLIPRGLDSLFDKMFNDINPADRKRSDRILMLATSPSRIYAGQNALLYSWLEDLEDPEFPYGAPIKAYSDQEIRDRHTSVRAQLDSLSKGLLEMKPSEWSHDVSTVASKDIYFGYEVDFFHRSVRDYLMEPVRYASIKVRLGEFDSAQAYQRLLLAEFKYARTMNEYLVDRSTALRSCFYNIFLKEDSQCWEMSSRYLDECGKVLEHHRQNPFPKSDEIIQNPGTISWGLSINAIERELKPISHDISYIHWLAYLGRQNDVMIHLMLTETSRTLVHEHSLLLTSSMYPGNHKLWLVRDLLKHGASPNQQITVISAHDPEEKRVTTVWAAFLIIMCGDVSSLLRQRLGMEFRQNYFLILEEYLSAGADHDVCFFFDKETEDTASHIDAMMMVTLQDFIIMEQPPNWGRLLELASKGKGSRFWNGTTQLLSTLRPWMGGLIEPEQNYRKARLDDLRAETATKWVLKSVCIRGDWLHSDFIVRLF